ncbi:hypothetical protein JQC91_00600 [Jannaschia sp. Os4]|uniref:hypothetical protein n=1 Tax=Jannaschia sp. Os4 TaxID=2807617 RepID=UPI0019398F6B|nr:hypothetical protein [Jannaschia sp. Os4]MBM2574790.1 hypothetical protein [Jannaschia sp. Os4]
MPSAPRGPRAGASPTADLYLGFSAEPLRADGVLRMVAPTVALAGDTLVILRHARGLRRPPPHRRVAWLIDDDVAAGLGDRALPWAYRAHLARTAWPAWRRWSRRADLILAASPALADRLRAVGATAPITVLPPAWPADAMARPGTGPIRRVALSMGLSHARDAAPLGAALADLLSRWPDLRVEVTGAGSGMAPLRGHARADLRPEAPWPAYWDRLRGRSYDLGLVPHLAGGPFNASRSGAKLGEHAVAGAAVLGQAGWAPGDAARRAGRALSVEGGAEAWTAAIEAALQDPAPARAAAEAAWTHLRADAAGERQRAVWRAIAEGTPPPEAAP